MFTSKLPRFATSAKRPSGPSDGQSTSYYSNIPLSVRKANLFTPQPNKFQHGTTSSTAKKSYMTTDKKYRSTKPAPDRDEQLKMFSNLVDYLEVNEPGFPRPDPKKFFMSVSTTEASRLFEVLITKIKPSFKLTKLELDVPEALADLRYPYMRSVTRSALVSITTRQAVVNLLIIYNWLVEKIKTMYHPSLENDDNYLVFATNGPAEDLSNDLDRQTIEAEAEYEKLIETLDGLQTEADRINEFVAAFNAVDEDINKCNEYQEEMDKYKGYRMAELTQAEKEYHGKDDKIENLEKECEILSSDPLTKINLQLSETDLKAVQQELLHVQQEFERVKSDMISEVNINDENIIRGLCGQVEFLDVDFKNHQRHYAKLTELLDADQIEAREHNDLVLKGFESYLEGDRLAMKAMVEKKKEEKEFFIRIEQQMSENTRIHKKGLKILQATLAN